MSESVHVFIIWAVVGVLFIGYGIYVCFSKKQKPFGFWANAGQNSGWIILPMVGTMLETIITMAIYVTVIEKKYRKK